MKFFGQKKKRKKTTTITTKEILLPQNINVDRSSPTFTLF